MPSKAALLFVLATRFLAVTAAWSAEATAEKSIYIRAGAVLGVESGQLSKNQIIVIRGDRIVDLGTSDQLTPPPGARVIDLSRMTVLPGLIDAHTHLLSDADDQGLRALRVSLPEATLNGVKNAARTLAAGFTTVRMVGAPGYADVALRDAIAAGDIVGPRLLVSGPPIGITGGHCSDNNLLPFEYGSTGTGVADGPWEIRRLVRQNVKFGVDLIKTCSTGGVLSKGTALGATHQ